MKNIIAIALIIFSLPLFADEVADAVTQAMDLYKKVQHPQAIRQLEYAAQLIRQQRGEALKNFLPQPLAGWTAEDADAAAVGASLFGGGTAVSRKYRKDNNRVTVSIATDSPLLQSVMMMFSNPMMFQSQGAKLKMINGQQVMMNKQGATAVVNNTYLVRVETKVEEDALAYISGIDFSGIANFK